MKVNINFAVKSLKKKEKNRASIGELITAKCDSVVDVGRFTTRTLTF